MKTTSLVNLVDMAVYSDEPGPELGPELGSVVPSPPDVHRDKNPPNISFNFSFLSTATSPKLVFTPQ